MDELRQSDLERDYPGWKFWRGVNGLPYAQRRRRSPPVTLRGEDFTDLRDQVRGWLGRMGLDALQILTSPGKRER